MAIDLGTGDGRAVLARARAEPATLNIGIDANAASMIESSRRAAKPERKGGQPNALFVVAAAEAPPSELASLAHELTVTMPWGSLLDGVLGRDDRVAAGIASLVASGGVVQAIVATAACDGRDLPVLDDSLAATIARAWAGHGLTLEVFRPASAVELAATHSTWARRLGLAVDAAAPRGRQPWLIELRPGSAHGTSAPGRRVNGRVPTSWPAMRRLVRQPAASDAPGSTRTSRPVTVAEASSPADADDSLTSRVATPRDERPCGAAGSEARGG